MNVCDLEHCRPQNPPSCGRTLVDKQPRLVWTLVPVGVPSAAEKDHPMGIYYHTEEGLGPGWTPGAERFGC